MKRQPRPSTVKAVTRRMQRAAADKRHAEYFAWRQRELAEKLAAIVAGKGNV